MDQDPTQLFVHCHGLREEEEQKIATLMEKVGLPVASTEGQSGEMYVQMTNSFLNDENNERNIDDLFYMIENKFEEKNINRYIGEGPGYQHLPFDWIYEFIIRSEEWEEKDLDSKQELNTDHDLEFNWGTDTE